MSNQSKIMVSVSETITFLRDQLKNEIVEKQNAENLNLDREQVRKICAIVDNSIQTSLDILNTKYNKHKINFKLATDRITIYKN